MSLWPTISRTMSGATSKCSRSETQVCLMSWNRPGERLGSRPEMSPRKRREDFLYSHQGLTFGAPRLRPEPTTRAGASNRESRAGRGTGESGEGRRGLAVAGRQLSPPPSGGSPTARRAAAHDFPATGSPLPAAAVPTVTPPMPRHTSRTRPSRSRRVRRPPSEDHSHRAGTPRIVRAGPSSLKRCFASRCAGRACGAPLTPEPLPA
jgi:hypothetical protein